MEHKQRVMIANEKYSGFKLVVGDQEVVTITVEAKGVLRFNFDSAINLQPNAANSFFVQYGVRRQW